VLSRLSQPHRATVDLDVVDRLLGAVPQLQVLRAAPGAEPVEPAAVALPTRYGPVRVDVLEVRQADLDHPSDDPGDRLHASAHAWAYATATEVTIEVLTAGGRRLDVTTPMAETGPLVAMKLQAVMNRPTGKEGTDLLDIIPPDPGPTHASERPAADRRSRPPAGTRQRPARQSLFLGQAAADTAPHPRRGRPRRHR
jgi:hypothetical protein